jgi:hypothetical protein
MSANPAFEWSYWVDYDPDISAALQRLRADVFARGDFATEDSPIAVGNRLIIPNVPPRPKPWTIEELLKREGKGGTGSILDITCISPKPTRRAISPFPESLLEEYFGSRTPSPSEVQEVYDFGSLEKFVTTRWSGIYVVCHFESKPSDIFFAGCSGD